MLLPSSALLNPVNIMPDSDLIINDLPGFRKDAYGLLQIDFTGELDGQTFFYLPTSSALSAFEFGYAIPFTNSIQSKSIVGFNTYDPAATPLIVSAKRCFQIYFRSPSKPTTYPIRLSNCGELLQSRLWFQMQHPVLDSEYQ